MLDGLLLNLTPHGLCNHSRIHFEYFESTFKLGTESFQNCLQCSLASSSRLVPGSLAGVEKCIRGVSEPGHWNFGFLISPTHAGFLAFPLCLSYFSLYSLFGLKSIFPSLGTAWHVASLRASFLFTHQK